MKYDFTQIGLVIKELRWTIGMNQQELCRGICGQSQLSKIESGDSTPLASTLYLISKKLGVSVEYIFEMTTLEKLDYILDFKQQIREFVRLKDYASILRYVKKEEGNPNFKKNPPLMQFLLWHKAISNFHLKGESQLALNYLHEALLITNEENRRFYLEQEIEIMNSIGVIHFEINEYQQAIDVYEKALQKIKRASLPSYSFKIEVRLIYNLVKAKTSLNQHEEAIALCQKALRICIAHESLYLLGELNYYVALNYKKMGLTEKSLPHFDKASMIFEMTKRTEYNQQIKKLTE